MEDDTDDEDFDSQEELLLLEEDDWVQPIKPIATRKLGQLLFNQWWKKSWRKGEKEKQMRKSRLQKQRQPHPILSNATFVM